MQIARTTIRIKTELKKKAQKRALEGNTTLQEIVNNALRVYLAKEKPKKYRKLISFNLGVPLDNLTRDDIYGDIPKKFRAR
jgi:hypothetical protein